MKTQDLFGSFFDPQDKRLAKLGDPLLRLAETVDWEQFRPLVGAGQAIGAQEQCGGAAAGCGADVQGVGDTGFVRIE